MANKVIDSLEKMKLATKEEEIIAISNEGRLEAIESCTLSLIGKFLMCKPFNKMAMKNTLRKAFVDPIGGAESLSIQIPIGI